MNPIPYDTDHSRVLEILEINDEGVFIWKKRPSERNPRNMVGQPAGFHHFKVNCRFIRFDGHGFRASRLAWFYYYGKWPQFRVRFKDGNPENFLKENLIVVGFDHGADTYTREGQLAYRRAHKAHIASFPDLKDYHTDRYYQKKFGITLAQYRELAASQDMVCSICENPERETRNGKIKALSVDHNHTTGQVRGLLCGSCNKAIGFLNEDPDLFAKAVSYLRDHEARDNVVLLPVKGQK
jgi:hypothetical protein